jgi:hypothetical protein
MASTRARALARAQAAAWTRGRVGPYHR